jgi:hypothetical protein
LFLARDRAGTLNVTRVLRDNAAGAVDKEAEDVSPPRLLILDFAIRDSIVHWHDQVPAEPVETVFGPINIAIAELNTLPQRVGQQEVIISTETQGTFSWSGSLQLNPLNSAGHAEIAGSHFPLTSAYMRHETGFDIVEGVADVSLDYNLSTTADGSLAAAVDNFELAFHDVLVRTFDAADDTAEREVARLPLLKIGGGTLRWPEQTVPLESLAIDDAAISVYRNAAGDFNILPADSAESADAAADAGSATADAGATADPWNVSLGLFAISGLSFDLEDDSVQPRALTGIESLNLSMRDLSNAAGAGFPTELELVPRSGGTVSLTGTLTALPEPLLDFSLGIENLALAGAHPYLKPLADVNLDSGALNMAAQLQSSAADPLTLRGDLSVVDFLITETDEGSRLGSWAKFEASGFTFSSAGESLEIAEIRLDEPYADVLIAADGSVNLGRVEKSGDDEPAGPNPADDAGAPLAVTIGKVVIADAAADFADLSLPLPFAANIAELNGDLTTIATTSAEPSTVTLEGKVDEFGLVRISGFVTPLDTSRRTDLKVAFQNVEMPKFSAYTIPFAGREIDNGRLDLDLGYRVTDSELVGENRIVLRDLELGDKVEHPGAMSLPLGLAVALLKDADGKIDIDLPVRGNVDDPEFRYGGVVLKALGTLIVKIVASPFALLGNLLGVEASELEFITFPPGRADLTPPELERAGKLAEALALRPELVLELRGAISRDVDGHALKAARLDAVVEARLSEAATDDASLFAQQQMSVLETLLSESVADDAAAAAALEELRLQFTTTTADAEAEATAAQFDELAYTSELRRQLVELETVDETELAALANGRASQSRAGILLVDPGLDGRVIVGGPQAVEADADEGVRMKVTLRTGDDSENADSAGPDQD